MQLENVKPNEVTIMSMLSACAQSGALDLGKWLHVYIIRSKIFKTGVLETALLDMYLKCGRTEFAQQVFDQMNEKDVAAWNAMITGLAFHGCQSNKVLDMFEMMQMEHAVQPNDVTMIGVLCACAQRGLVDEGKKYFSYMVRSLISVRKLSTTDVWLIFSAAGFLNEAYEMIENMPVDPHTGVWGASLGACKIHGNVELAELAIKHLMILDKDDGGYCTTLSNLYVNAGRWNDAAKIRGLMKEERIGKVAGCSCIEIDGEVHEFGAGDDMHPRSKEIYEMLEEMSKRLSTDGYVARTSEVFYDVHDEEKEHALCYHSEKLALSYGLISTPSGSSLQIVKNLRVCVDCHSFMKHASKIFGREILVRDRSRFHHFKQGVCSCHDYW